MVHLFSVVLHSIKNYEDHVHVKMSDILGRLGGSGYNPRVPAPCSVGHLLSRPSPHLCSLTNKQNL